MIQDLYLNPFYWVGVVGLLAIGARLTRSAVLGFRFVALLFLTQFFMHSFLVFGVASPITWFCASAWIVFVAVSLPVVSARLVRPADRLIDLVAPTALDRTRLDLVWFWVARLFLLVFWCAHLVVYPISFGSLDLGSRLAEQQDNKVFFFIGQLTLPVIAACMAVWLRRRYRFTWLDLVVIALTIVGMFSGGSKATLLPLALAFFGAAELAGRRLREFKRVLGAALVLGILAGARLLLYFPDQSPMQTASLMLYRVAANTDSLEYLKVLGVAPSAYPAAGPLALIPYISKRFGYDYPYPPGVWLFGSRYGNWTGQGPNSGLVMDVFGNLSWAGLILVAVLSLVLAVTRRSGSAIAVSAASIVYLAFVDVTLFDIPFIVWSPVVLALAFVVRSRRGAVVLGSIGRRLRVLDAPLPRVSRRTGHAAGRGDAVATPVLSREAVELESGVHLQSAQVVLASSSGSRLPEDDLPPTMPLSVLIGEREGRTFSVRRGRPRHRRSDDELTPAALREEQSAQLEAERTLSSGSGMRA